jgi:hypothetical protein
MSDFGRSRQPARSAVTNKLDGRVSELRSALRSRSPELVAAQSGISYHADGPDCGKLHIPFWGDIVTLSFPELTGLGKRNEPLPDFQLALLLYHLVTADGAPLTGKWVSFAELPGGRIYNTAFQGYSGDEIVKRFGIDLDGFKSVCLEAGGQPVEIGNASFRFQALPRLPLLATYWLGDEDFPSSCKILFDGSACHYLPVDVCAILGSALTRKLIRH